MTLGFVHTWSNPFFKLLFYYLGGSQVSIGNVKNKLSSVIFIPYWIAETIQRMGLALSDVVDYEKIRPTLSMHDMAGFMAVQYESDRLLYSGSPGDGPVSCMGNDLITVWRFLTHAWPVEQGTFSVGKKTSEDFNRTYEYAGDATVKGDVVSRLYGQAVKQARYDHAFDVVNLAPQVVGVVVYPGYFDQAKIDLSLQHQLICSLMQVFYAQGAPYEQIAATAIYRRHLELLSGEQS